MARALLARHAAAAATLLACVLVAPPALADDSGTRPGAPELLADSVLATPDEVAQMGGTPDQVAQQEEAWASLPADTRAAQASLNASEHALAEDAFANIQPSAPSFTGAASSLVAAASAGPHVCNGDNWYKVDNFGILPTNCFYGTGTYSIIKFVEGCGDGSVRLWPGDYQGRVYYYFGKTFYWSTTRGPGDHSWHAFSMSYDQCLSVQKVQLY